jgi:hypothetical protein
MTTSLLSSDHFAIDDADFEMSGITYRNHSSKVLDKLRNEYLLETYDDKGAIDLVSVMQYHLSVHFFSLILSRK